MATEISFIEIALNLGVNFLTLLAMLIGLHLVSNQIKLKNKLLPLFIGFALIIWFFLAVFLGLNDFFIPNPTAWAIPNIVLIFLPIIVGLILLKYSEDFKKIVEVIPTHWIIVIQVYRLLGIIFITLYLQGLLPGEFAIPTGVGDIIVGFTAPIIAFMYLKKKIFAREIAIAWNYLGIADLLLALTLGILTSPSAIQVLALNNQNKLVTAFPLVMVPAFAVPLSILLHIFSLKVLLKK